MSTLPRQTFGHLTRPFDTPDFHKIYKVNPVHNVYQLDMNWALPPLLDKFRIKPLNYLSWVIGHEGIGTKLTT
jgi:nardilysin